MMQSNMIALLPIAAGVGLPLLGVAIYLLTRKRRRKNPQPEETQDFGSLIKPRLQDNNSLADGIAADAAGEAAASTIPGKTRGVAILAELRQEMEERLAVVEESQRVCLEPVQQELNWLRTRVRELEKDIEVLMRGRHDAAIYGRAMEFARQGLSAQQLAFQCGISQSEAELIVAMQQNKGNLDNS